MRTHTLPAFPKAYPFATTHTLTMASTTFKMLPRDESIEQKFETLFGNNPLGAEVRDTSQLSRAFADNLRLRETLFSSL